jgi:hypothetical protein
MKKTILMGLIVGAIGATMITSLGTSNLAFAQAKNLFGQEARQLAQCDVNCLPPPAGPEPNTNKGGMGQHSSSSVSGGSGPAGQRVGIGNVGEDILGIGKAHPSEVISTLCGPTGGTCP